MGADPEGADFLEMERRPVQKLLGTVPSPFPPLTQDTLRLEAAFLTGVILYVFKCFIGTS